MVQILTKQPAPPSRLCSDVDRQLEAICLKAMSKNVGDRYGNMTEFVSVLDDYLRQPAVRPAARKDGQRWGWVTACAAAAIGLLLLAYFLMPPSDQTNDQKPPEYSNSHGNGTAQGPGDASKDTAPKDDGKSPKQPVKPDPKAQSQPRWELKYTKENLGKIVSIGIMDKGER